VRIWCTLLRQGFSLGYVGIARTIVASWALRNVVTNKPWRRRPDMPWLPARLILWPVLHRENVYMEKPFLDGGLNVHNQGIGLGRFFRSNPVFLFMTTAPDERIETIDLVGNLCTSADCLGQNVEAPRLEEGDLIVIQNLESLLPDDGIVGF